MKTAALLAAAAAAPTTLAQPSQNSFEDNGRVVQVLRSTRDLFTLEDIDAAGNKLAALVRSTVDEEDFLIVYEADGSGGWRTGASVRIGTDTSRGEGPLANIALAGDARDSVLVAGMPDDDRVFSYGFSFFGSINTEAAWLEQPEISSPFAPGSRFGAAVDAQATGVTYWVLTGAPNEDTMGQNAGAAYLSRQVQGTGTLPGDDEFYPTGGAGERFGAAVSMYRRPGIVQDDEVEWYIAIGAPGADNGEGAVYIFTQLGDISANFVLDQRIPNPRPADCDNFGQNIAITQDYLIVGTPDINNNRGGYFGFTRDANGTWTSAGVTASMNTAVGTRMGAAVDTTVTAIDDVETVVFAVGAPGYQGVGRTRVIARNGFNDFLGFMNASDPAASLIDQYGVAVAIPDGAPSLVYSAAAIYETNDQVFDGAIFQSDLAPIQIPTLANVTVNEGEEAEFEIQPTGGSGRSNDPGDAAWLINDARPTLPPIISENDFTVAPDRLTIDPAFAALSGATIQYTVADAWGRYETSNQATLTVLTPDTADINKDGTVDVFDLIAFLQAFSAALN